MAREKGTGRRNAAQKKAAATKLTGKEMAAARRAAAIAKRSGRNQNEVRSPFEPAIGWGTAVTVSAARASSSARLAQEFLANLASGTERPKRKVSVTVDADLWDEVSRLVDDEAADTASAAVETALAMWAANQRLRELLDEIYDETPDARPTDEEVAAAAELLGLP